MLDVKDLVVNYGGIQAVKGVSFRVQTGEIVALIGRTGPEEYDSKNNFRIVTAAFRHHPL